MSDVVLDASAVLAMLRGEPGSEVVAEYIGHAAISAVNLQEVAKEMVREGVSIEAVREVLDELALDLHPHDREAAYQAAALFERTKRYGRGLGDRSCMALGLALGVPVITTDTEWKSIELDGLRLEFAR